MAVKKRLLEQHGIIAAPNGAQPLEIHFLQHFFFDWICSHGENPLRIFLAFCAKSNVKHLCQNIWKALFGNFIFMSAKFAIPKKNKIKSAMLPFIDRYMANYLLNVKKAQILWLFRNFDSAPMGEIHTRREKRWNGISFYSMNIFELPFNKLMLEFITFIVESLEFILFLLISLEIWIRFACIRVLNTKYKYENMSNRFYCHK